MGGVGHSMLAGVQDFDRLATFDSPLHRRDPRAKVMVALLAAVVAVSYSKYAVSAMPHRCWCCLFLAHAKRHAAALLPAQPARGVAHAVFFVAIFNPWFDRARP